MGFSRDFGMQSLNILTYHAEADHVVVVRAHRGRVLILHAVLGVAIALTPASPDSSISLLSD